MAYDTPVPGYDTPPSTTCGSGRRKSSRDFDLKYFNEGNYIRAVEDKNESENISKVLYPDDIPRRDGTAAQAAVLLRLRIAPGHHPPLREETITTFDWLPGQGRHPAERHPPVPGHRRADADAHRRAAARVGQRLGHHRADLRLHQPHPPARGAGDMAGRPVRATSCPAICRSSTRSTAVSSTRCGDAVPGDAGTAQRHVAHRGGLANAGPDGAPGHCRQPFGQRRVAALHTESHEADDLPRTFTRLCPERFSNNTNGITQRRWLQRRNRGSPRSSPSASATAGSATWTELQEARATRRRPGVPERVAGGQAGATRSGSRPLIKDQS